MLASCDRAGRFGDWDNCKELFQSGKLGSTRPFFEGAHVRERMNLIRRSIRYIRHNWDRYDEFLQDLQSLLKEENSNFGDNIAPPLNIRFKRLFSTRKRWNDRISPTEKTIAKVDDYDAVYLYTAEATYQQIFSFLNRVFRSELSGNSERLLASVVFLVELINIDLYNYVRHTGLEDFQGVVYRGMGISREDFHAFSTICEQPLSERYISIPLGMISASQKPHPAKQFISQRLKEDPTKIPLMWKIHVISLEEKLLQVYNRMFPTSVVSSICAVPISSLSCYPQEEEVLLRGPFFQVLNFYKQGMIDEKPLYVLELMMLNSNRDHPSNAELGENADLAQSVFRNIISISRNRFCLEYCKRHGLVDDAVEYNKRIAEDKQKLNKLKTS